MIDQAAFTRMLRRLSNFDRDDFAEVAKDFVGRSDGFTDHVPTGDWNMCQMDPARYFLQNGRAIQDRMFRVLVRSESVQTIMDEDA